MSRSANVKLDRRLHAFRDDLADILLKDRVDAKRYVKGEPATISAPVADLRSAPDAGSGLDAQALFGEMVQVFEDRDGWAWVQRNQDDYVGYTHAGNLSAPSDKPTHCVAVPRTFVYSAVDLKSPMRHPLSMGSRLRIVDAQTVRGTNYLIADDGSAVIARHVCSIEAPQQDYVSVAESLLGTPYLWGGNSAFGIDCSGLVGLAMMMCGKLVLRDTDMMVTTCGEEIEPGDDFEHLKRGDLVFWKGHVGIMTDPSMLLHANGHTMDVAREPLAEAMARIGYLYGQPTCVRRP